jgi:hypothetical protein
MTALAVPGTANYPSTDTAALEGEAVRLTGSLEQINDSVRALLFGELVKRAGRLEWHHSDLYHDAAWLAAWLTGPMTFCWAPRTCGTAIGTDQRLVTTAGTGEIVYRVDLRCERRGTWWATFTAVDDKH